jgi:hypothetical protein
MLTRTPFRMHDMSHHEVSCLLAAIEARRSFFEESLVKANAVMEKLFHYATPPIIADGPFSSMQSNPWYENLGMH